MAPSSTTVPSPMKTCSPMKAAPFGAVVEAGVEIGNQVGLDVLQRIPGILAPVKDGRVGGLGEVEQVRWLEHGVRLRQRERRENHFLQIREHKAWIQEGSGCRKSECAEGWELVLETGV